MIVADQNALAGVFAADDVAPNGLGHEARIGKREIFANYAAPAVGAEFNRSHERFHGVYAKRIVLKQPLWLVSEEIVPLLLFEPFDEFSDVLGAVFLADQESVRSFYNDEIAGADDSREFSGN